MHKSHSHQKLEMRQSVVSQITTVEDVDEICQLSMEDDDEEDDDAIEDDILGGVGSSSLRYSSSHSANSSLSSTAVVLTRDNIIIP